MDGIACGPKFAKDRCGGIGMIEKIFSLALDTGLIAALFTGLLIYILRDSKKREEKYQSMISQLHDTLKVVKTIHDDVVEIKKTIKGERE